MLPGNVGAQPHTGSVTASWIPLSSVARNFLIALDGLQKEYPGDAIRASDVEAFLSIDPFETALTVRELVQHGYISVPSLTGEEGYFNEHTIEPLLFTKAGRKYLTGV